MIQRNIVEDCNTAGGVFSISSDEVRYIGNHEKTRCNNYVFGQGKPDKRKFSSVCRLSMLVKAQKGEILWKELLYFTCKVGLDPQKMRSQRYNGAARMSEKIKGVSP